MKINFIFILALFGSSTLAFADVSISPELRKLIDTPKTNVEALDNPPKLIRKEQQANPITISQPNSATDLVLVCEEMREERPLKRPPWSEFDRLENERTNERNKNIVRPYLAIKYLGGKLSFNNNGLDLLINEIPEVPNSRGLVGRILIKEDIIYLDHERLSGTRTTLDIDRYTGLYKSYTFNGDELLYKAEGKCKKYNERLF